MLGRVTFGDRYSELRGLAFGVAYRMLGTASDAEDVVQDAFLRLQEAPAPEAVRDPEAYLVTVTTRVAIDQLRSARVRRESYVGSWLPEPLLTGPEPADTAVRSDSLSTAVLLLLETLTPVERAVFVLREAFGYDYDEIAAIVGKSAVNCRQVFARANRRVADGRPRFETSPAERRRLVGELLAACERGDLDGLVDLLSEDVAFHGDGGGKVRALAHPVSGAAATARLLLTYHRNTVERGDTVAVVDFGYQPGLLVTGADGTPVGAVAFACDAQVREIHSVVNPDKLTALAEPVAVA